jgi:hypothetical protein
LAIEYVHRFGASYRGGVYWVDSDLGLAALVSQISEAAGVAVDTKAEEQSQVQQLWAALNKMPPSLTGVNVPTGRRSKRCTS